LRSSQNGFFPSAILEVPELRVRRLQLVLQQLLPSEEFIPVGGVIRIPEADSTSASSA
jgi:hypothetical protein